MKMLRRALIAIGGAATIAAILRMRGIVGTQPQSGGWRPITGSQ